MRGLLGLVLILGGLALAASILGGRFSPPTLGPLSSGGTEDPKTAPGGTGGTQEPKPAITRGVSAGAATGGLPQ